MLVVVVVVVVVVDVSAHMGCFIEFSKDGYRPLSHIATESDIWIGGAFLGFFEPFFFKKKNGTCRFIPLSP
jgi:hypothetical protein